MRRRFAVALMALAPLLAFASPGDDAPPLFQARCVPCHGNQAVGTPGLAPPLAGRLPASAREQVILTLLNGLTGEINVGGEVFDGVMPSFASVADSDLAAVANYLIGLDKTGMTNDGKMIIDADISAARKIAITTAALRERRRSTIPDAAKAP